MLSCSRPHPTLRAPGPRQDGVHRTAPFAAPAGPQARRQPGASPRQADPLVVPRAIQRSRSNVANSLISVLVDELKMEKNTLGKQSSLLDNPPDKFFVEGTPSGSALLRLGRQLRNETIYVTVDLEAQQPATLDDLEDEEEEDEEEPLATIMFTVHVVKGRGGDCLEFSCETDGTYVEVLSVKLVPGELDEDGEEYNDDAVAEQTSMFTGPVFRYLDATLQQAFTDYLEERGIDDKLGDWLVAAARERLSVEYMGWLERVTKFIAK